MKNRRVFTLIDTPLGSLLGVADETFLYRLEFVSLSDLEKKIKNIEVKQGLSLVEGSSEPLRQIQQELKGYFSRVQTVFQTPLFPEGSAFQKRVWQALLKVESGKTCSYRDIAKAIGHPAACRAVGTANGANPLVIIVPCHRVIQHNGTLGGYSSGLERKRWLLKHEGHHPP